MARSGTTVLRVSVRRNGSMGLRRSVRWTYAVGVSVRNALPRSCAPLSTTAACRATGSFVANAGSRSRRTLPRDHAAARSTSRIGGFDLSRRSTTTAGWASHVRTAPSGGAFQNCAPSYTSISSGATVSWCSEVTTRRTPATADASIPRAGPGIPRGTRTRNRSRPSENGRAGRSPGTRWSATRLAGGATDGA